MRGEWNSPAGTLVAWKVDSSPGEKCAAELGFPRVYAWVVTGSLLFGSHPPPPPTCMGLLTTDFAVSTSVRRVGSIPACLCYSSLGTIYQQAQPAEVSTVPTVFFSYQPTWIVLVVVCLSYSLVWWNIMSSGKLPAMDQEGTSPTSPRTFCASHWTWGLIDCMTWCKTFHM